MALFLMVALLAAGAAGESVDVYLQRGEQALRDGDAVAARGAFQAARELEPQSWQAHDGLGRAWRAAGDLEAAQRELRTAVALAPPGSSPARHFVDLIALLPEGEARREAWRWIGEHAAGDLNIQLQVARAARLSGDMVTAEQALARALSLDPGSLQARVDQIRVARDSLDYARAEALAKAFIRDFPRYAETHAQLGRIYQLQDRSDDAVREYEKALQMEPDHVTALHRLGEIKMRQGDLEAAAKLLKLAVMVAPDHYPAHYVLGQVYYRMGDREAGARELAIFRRIKDAKRAHTRLAGGAAMEDD
jgi:tetratricopeptide (TPR) repeat protein